MPSAEWWEGRPRAAGRLGVCCVFCRQSWEDQDHLDLVCPHDTPRVAGVSGNKTKLRPWWMATAMTMANATHSGGKVESVAIMTSSKATMVEAVPDCACPSVGFIRIA